jgi:Ca2+-binding RTX toxin-like protein
MSDSARAGNDTLISSADSDHMWGDAQYINNLAASPSAPIGNVRTGADTFVFGVHNGNDDINDFVRAYGFHSFADLTIMAAGGNMKIAFDTHNSVTLLGVSEPNVRRASDFILA